MPTAELGTEAANMNRRRRAGFTLVELLVVISITIILLALIFGPIIGTFNLTRQANAMVTAQDTARNTLELISRELGQAMFIYDNSNSPTNFPVQQPDGSTTTIPALYGKVDFILPKLVMHCNDPTHLASNPRDYDRGDEAWPPCPFDGSTDVEARPKEPLELDNKIVRYFVGLADPDPHADPSVSPQPGYRDWAEVGAPLNGFILYRAEFDPYDTKFVKQDAKGNPILDDPDFFNLNSGDDPSGVPYWKNWKAIARPVGPQTDIDLVTLRMDTTTNPNTIAAVTPSVRFQLTQLTNDSFSPAYITDEGAEAPVSIPPIFRATYGAWGSSRGPFTPDMYNVTVIRYNDPSGNDITWFRTEWDGNGDLVVREWAAAGAGLVVFNISAYEENGSFTPTAQPDLAFLVDPVRGEVRFDFPASDVIDAETIAAMNENVRLNWQSKVAAPSRAHRIPMFMNLVRGAPYQPRIVPGSEVVRGPDMTPGLAPGQIRMVRYERVPFNLGDPGRNQYKIDYGATDATGGRVGWIIFSPAPDEPMPETVTAPGSGSLDPASIEIRYRFQLNHDGDTVIGNYATKTLMMVTLGIRFYDRNSGKVHPVELTNKVRVRNLMR